MIANAALFYGCARVLATLLDNGPAWVIVDMALARAGAVHIPIPVFFTEQVPAKLGPTHPELLAAAGEHRAVGAAEHLDHDDRPIHNHPDPDG